MSVYMGDFLGFQLGDEHSYGVNITRVSTNDRYLDNLLPNFTDQTAQVPGGDGTYYWGTQYTSKNFTIEFAFDDLRDEDLRKLRQMFSFRTVKPLIFDEFPYKKYMVKCQAAPSLRYLCFDHMEFRIYKGEGSVNLIAYYPFAFSVVSPSLAYNAAGSIINNSGDMPANIEITYRLADIVGQSFDITLSDDSGTQLGLLSLGKIQILNPDKDIYMRIDTRTQLIEGLDSNFQKTGVLYNKFTTGGDFLFPPPGRSRLQSGAEFLKAQYTPLYY